jgi:glycine cleavage system H protein
MGVVRGCHIPDDLYYNIKNNIWARHEKDGLLTLGMTAYFCSLAGHIVSVMPKKMGKSVKQNKSCATVESGKWVGPLKAPASGEVIAINESLISNPSLINQDPYGEGWVIKLRPNRWEQESTVLVTGAEALRAFEAKMEEEGFSGC